jgi:hypothetical protein
MCATPILGLASRSRVNPSGRSIALAVAKPVMVALRSGTPPFSAIGSPPRHQLAFEP